MLSLPCRIGMRLRIQNRCYDLRHYSSQVLMMEPGPSDKLMRENLRGLRAGLWVFPSRKKSRPLESAVKGSLIVLPGTLSGPWFFDQSCFNPLNDGSHSPRMRYTMMGQQASSIHCQREEYSARNLPPIMAPMFASTALASKITRASWCPAADW